MKETFQVTAQESGQRLDLFCVSKLPGVSRSSIQKAIKEEQVQVNDLPAKSRQAVQEGDVVTVTLEEQTVAPAEPMSDITLPIIFESQDIVVINKPAGVSIHPELGRRVYPGEKQEGATVASWFAKRYPNAVDVGESPERPGIVHRLDKDTSGTSGGTVATVAIVEVPGSAGYLLRKRLRK